MRLIVLALVSLGLSTVTLAEDTWPNQVAGLWKIEKCDDIRFSRAWVSFTGNRIWIVRAPNSEFDKRLFEAMPPLTDFMEVYAVNQDSNVTRALARKISIAKQGDAVGLKHRITTTTHYRVTMTGAVVDGTPRLAVRIEDRGPDRSAFTMDLTEADELSKCQLNWQQIRIDMERMGAEMHQPFTFRNLAR